MVSGIEQIIDPAWMGVTWRVTLAHADAVGWDRERLDMLLDGLWLVDQAMGGEWTEGPLSLPRIGLPVRT